MVTFLEIGQSKIFFILAFVIVNNTNTTTGNLLSNVAPPTNIPNFTIWTSKAVPSVNTTLTMSNTNTVVTAAPILVNQFPNTQFR